MIKRLQKISILFLLIPFLLSGSGLQKKQKKHSFLKPVTQVDIICRRGDTTIRRHYTNPRKIEPVLDYLRLLKYRGKAETDPEKITGDKYVITLQYANEETHIYRQYADKFISKDNHRWEKIDPDQAKHFCTLLQIVPGDQ